MTQPCPIHDVPQNCCFCNTPITDDNNGYIPAFWDNTRQKEYEGNVCNKCADEKLYFSSEYDEYELKEGFTVPQNARETGACPHCSQNYLERQAKINDDDIRAEICTCCDSDIAIVRLDVYALEGEAVGQLISSPEYMCENCLNEAFSENERIQKYLKNKKLGLM